MPVTIKLPTPLRRHCAQSKTFSTPASDVREALGRLIEAYPPVQASLFDEAGALKSFVRVFVDGTDIDDLEGLATPLQDGSVVSIVPPVAGA